MRIALQSTLILAALGCRPSFDEEPRGTAPVTSQPGDSATPDTGETGDTDTDGTDPPVDPNCDDIAPLPVTFTKLDGFTTAEDFAFDIEGHFVSTDNSGSIVKITMDGDKTILSPGFGDSAGTAYLPNGDLMMAQPWAGNLVRITPDGGQINVLSGLNYPNGVTVDLDGMAYVAEHDAGRVRQVDPDSGDFVVIGEGLFNPNGLHFGPNHEVLYVGSFGGGTVHAIERDGKGGWIPPRLFGDMTDATAQPPACEGLSEGDECFLESSNRGIGLCEQEGGELSCNLARDHDACTGKSRGDSCTTSALGESLSSVCLEPLSGGDLFCPRVPGEVVSSCMDQQDNDPCEAKGEADRCEPSWENVLICDITSWSTVTDEACEGLAPGDECVVVDYEGYGSGECKNQGGGLTCDVPNSGGGGSFGGLDGVASDICGNVYVTEYVTGIVWRFPAGGGTAELVASTGSFWIPNMHWGLDVGGFSTDVLYVQDRDSNGMYALEVGIQSAPVAYTP